MGRWLGQPALHFVLGGVLLFCALEAWRGWGPAFPDRSVERPRVVVTAAEVAEAREEIELRVRRSLTAAEEAEALGTAIDHGILLTLALQLGLDRQPEIERRLAQIASFVAEGDGDAVDGEAAVEASRARWADEARRLGLGRGDRVVRSLLIDRARRLIRAAMLIREPSDQTLEAFLREYPGEFQEPAELAIDILFLGRATPPSGSPEWLLEASVADGLGVESWPALTERELRRRLGSSAAATVVELEAESWRGPLASRDGYCLVRVRAVKPGRVSTLAEVRDRVRAKARQRLADRWLRTRLEQLRQEYEVVVETGEQRGEVGDRAVAELGAGIEEVAGDKERGGERSPS